MKQKAYIGRRTTLSLLASSFTIPTSTAPSPSTIVSLFWMERRWLTVPTMDGAACSESSMYVFIPLFMHIRTYAFSTLGYAW